MVLFLVLVVLGYHVEGLHAFLTSSSPKHNKKHPVMIWKSIDNEFLWTFWPRNNKLWRRQMLLYHTTNTTDVVWKKRIVPPPLTKDDFIAGGIVANITYKKDNIKMLPFLMVEISSQPPDEKCVQISRPNDEPFFWYRVVEGWYGCNYVQRPVVSLDVIPKIKSWEVEEYRKVIEEQQEKEDNKDDDKGQPLFFQFWA